MMSADRASILRAVGTRGAEVDELLAYAESGFDLGGVASDVNFPLADEPFVEAWSDYAREAEHAGVAATLATHLVQLRFPIAAGMSGNAEYLAATRRGVLPADDAKAPAFVDPNGLSIRLHQTPAGRLPVVIAERREDFETLIRALARHNEPAVLPASMGACIIGGYNDWSRVAEHRAAWSAARGGATEDEWRAEFQRMLSERWRYQDRFVVLSTGPYSDTAAAALGLRDDEWRRASLTIRLEHECAHYFTKRVLGSMRNSLLDELIADYTGVVAARGRFEPEWVARFMGVERPGEWRASGRLVNYRGNPPLSDGAFVVLQELVRRAVITLDRFDLLVLGAGCDARPRSMDEVARAIIAMAAIGLEPLAESSAAYTLYDAFVDADRGAGVLTS